MARKKGSKSLVLCDESLESRHYRYYYYDGANRQGYDVAHLTDRKYTENDRNVQDVILHRILLELTKIKAFADELLIHKKNNIPYYYDKEGSSENLLHVGWNYCIMRMTFIVISVGFCGCENIDSKENTLGIEKWRPFVYDDCGDTYKHLLYLQDILQILYDLSLDIPVDCHKYVEPNDLDIFRKAIMIMMKFFDS